MERTTSKGIKYDDAKDKFRYWLFEFYEESVREDWEKVLLDSGFEFAVSPWHRNDVNEDGTLKKPHKHAIFHTPGNNPLNYNNVLKRLSCLDVAANGYIEPSYHPRQSMRYLIHLDNPDKSQFEHGRNEIQNFNGFPLDLTRELTLEQKREVRKKCFAAIKEYNFREYCDVMDYCLWELGDDEMFDYVCSHTIMFKGYLDSLRNSGR